MPFRMTILRILAASAVIASAMATSASEKCEAIFVGPAQSNASTTVVATEPAVHIPMPLTKSLLPKGANLIGLKLVEDRVFQEIKSDKDPRFKSALQRLVGMLADTMYLSASRKFTEEKGQLRLGKVFGNGLSVELEYEGDLRSDRPKAFRLRKIYFYKPSGQEVVLSKDPVTDDGHHLKQKEFLFAQKDTPVAGEDLPLSDISVMGPEKVKDWVEANGGKENFVLGKEQNSSAIKFLQGNNDLLVSSDRDALAALHQAMQTIEIPLVIQGPLYEEFMKWADRLDHLQRTEIRALVDAGRIDSLVWKSRWRASLEFMADRAKRKLVGLVMIGVLVAGAPAAIDWAKETMTDHFPKIRTEQIEQVGFGPDDTQVIVNTLNRFTDQWANLDPNLMAKIQKRAVAPSPRSPIDETYEFSHFVQERWERELNLPGGHVRVFLGDSNLKGLVERKGETPLVDPTAMPNTGVLVYHFKKHDEIVIAPLTLVNGSKVPSVRALIIRQQEFPVLYGVLKSRIEAGFNQL